MHLHAARAVAAAADIDHVVLGYDVASLHEVDRVLGSFHDDDAPVDAVATITFLFGAYIGEVIRRVDCGEWVHVSEGHPLSGGDFPVMTLPGGAMVNPVGKAFKRVRNGTEDFIPYFYDVLVARRDR